MNTETDDQLLYLTKAVLTLKKLTKSLKEKFDENDLLIGDYIDDTIEFCDDAIEMIREAQEDLFEANKNEQG